MGSVPGSGRFHWRRKWQPTPVFLPGESHGQRSLVGYSPWSRKESDMTEHIHTWEIYIYKYMCIYIYVHVYIYIYIYGWGGGCEKRRWRSAIIGTLSWRRPMVSMTMGFISAYSSCPWLTCRGSLVESHFCPWRVGVYQHKPTTCPFHGVSVGMSKPPRCLLTPSPFIMTSLPPNSCDRLSVSYVAEMI